MSLPQTLIHTVDRYWAGILDCEPEKLRLPGYSVVVTEKSPGLTALRTSDGWVISVRPEVDQAVLPETAKLLMLGRFEDGSARARIHQRFHEIGMVDLYGPSELLFATREMLIPYPIPEFRRLVDADADTVEAFRIGMGGVLDWRIGQPQTWPYVIGTFENERLVAVGAVRNWGDVIAETYVDVLPTHRGKGLANGLTYEISRWIVEETSLIAQAGGEIINPAAGRISRRLGYQLYGTLLMNNLCRRQT